MKRRWMGMALVAVWLPCGASQEFLPPPDVAWRALAAQPEVRAAAARVDVAAAQSRALDVGAYEWEASAIPQRRSAGASGDFDEWEAQIGRRFRLPGKARLDRRIGEHGAAAAEMRLDDAIHQAARRLASAWMEWLRAGWITKEADAQSELLRRGRAALARRVELGDAARRELELFEAEAAQWQVEAVTAQAGFEAAQQALAAAFPQLPVPERTPDLPEPEALPGGAAYWRELIVARSHEIGIAEQEAARQARIAERARAERHPDPSLGLRVMSDRGGAEHAIGLVLGVPFGGRHRSALADGEAALAQAARAEAEAMRLMIGQEAWAAVQAAESRFRQWQAQRAALRAQAAAAARSRRAFELGEAGLAETLLAQRNERQARLAEARTRVDALEAALRVYVDSHELWHSGDIEPQAGAGGAHP